MGQYFISIATSTSVNESIPLGVLERRPWNRTLVSWGLAGGAALNDCSVRIMVEDTEVGTLANDSTALIPDFNSMSNTSVPVPAGALLRVLVLDVPGTNPCVLKVVTAP